MRPLIVSVVSSIVIFAPITDGDKPMSYVIRTPSTPVPLYRP
jgi:hypothetical protein